MNHIYFSDFFRIDPDIIDSYGALDISLLNDLPLFIDPFLIFCSDDSECQKMHEEIIRYLVYLRDKAVNSRQVNTSELRYLYCFPEVRQTYLGFCQNGNYGSGLGMDFAKALHAGLKTAFSDFGNETITKGKHLEKVCLLKEGVGKDNISDFITNLVKPYLCTYTEQFAKTISNQSSVPFSMWINASSITPMRYGERENFISQRSSTKTGTLILFC